MLETLGGVLALAVILGIPIGVLVLSRRRRPVDEVITRGSAHGRDGLAVHPWRGHPSLDVVAWVFVAVVLGLGVFYLLGGQPYAAAFCLVGGGLMAYIVWARFVGRAGDGTLTLTAEGLHQHHAGSEVFVPWEDVRGLVTTPTDLIVETTRPAVPTQRMLPLLGRRKVVQDDAVALPSRMLPPLPYQDMIALYSESVVAREELDTDAPVDRARDLLRGFQR
ncbi:hypothetical protein [Knoellia sp. LjRoot47]|uniref:hypothetical protein n=1 Tax=Knoellia sp. LjRoot47 TaxID=3342330 RepID=UPI003ED0BF78